MTIEEKVGELVSRLQMIRQWSWQVSDVAEFLQAFKITDVEVVESRQTYETADGGVIDVYTDGNALEFVEIEVDSFDDVDELDDYAYESKVDEYLDKFESAVRVAEHVLGPPAFNDGFGTPGFPRDQDAIWLALWPIGESRLMIEQKNEGRDLPFRLAVVVAPRQRSRRN